MDDNSYVPLQLSCAYIEENIISSLNYSHVTNLWPIKY